MKKGLLLINLGTPDAPDVASVRRYLQEFLSDYRVIDLPAPVRYLLLYAFILPFRPKQSAHAYQAIWTDQGSPLLLNGENLVKKIQAALGEKYHVALGMRYGNPSIAKALHQLTDCAQITALPLYPQYSSAATGSSLEKVMALLSKQVNHPSLTIVRDFYQHPGFIRPQADIIRQMLSHHDHLLFSYHGIPERHIVKSGCEQVCVQACPSIGQNETCYRAQCYATSAALAKELNLADDFHSTSFQSRLGKTPWIKPYTDHVLPELAKRGIKRLAVCCPSFTADCLETLEEIGIRSKQQWLELGGDELTLIPCVNDSDEWVKGIIQIAQLATNH